MASDKSGFFEELKRRHVWRVAIAYAIAGWLLVQIATQVFPFFNIPNWAVRLVVILIVIGFPVAVAFAWIYELTPEGIRRTVPADSPEARPEHEHRQIGRKLNAMIMTVLVLAVAVLGWRLFAVRHAMALPATSKVVAAATPAASVTAVGAAKAPVNAAVAPVSVRSIAVLPFENLNVDKKDAYFVAGVQDLILTKLADVGDLKVIARTSTAMYPSHPENLTRIGEQLGVATILEGSVQQAGNQVLINVQLIDAKTDSHIWAQAYTRTLDNVFGVEGDVAQQIAAALKTKLSGAETASLAAVPTTNRAAYNLFLRAEYATHQSDTSYYVGGLSGYRAAIPLYRQAIEADPNFALAYARLSYTESNLAWLGGENVESLNRAARADAEHAEKLAPHAAATQLALGYCDYYGQQDYPTALRAFAAALAQRPNDSQALAAQGFVERMQLHFESAIASLEKAFALDPKNSALADEIGSTYMEVGRYPEAENWLQRALALDPDNLDAKHDYSTAIFFDTGDAVRALAVAQGDSPSMCLTRYSLLTYQRKYPQALALLQAIPDTADNFPLVAGQTKTGDEADLYQWGMHDPAKARPLFAKVLAALRPQLAQSEQTDDVSLVLVWQNIADAELGLGETRQGLAAIAQARAVAAKTLGGRPAVHTYAMEVSAGLYAEADRPDLAVPLLDKALATHVIGQRYSPVLLWLDPSWDPIRHDPRFQELLQKYAKYKPAVTYDIPPAASSSGKPTPTQPSP